MVLGTVAFTACSDGEKTIVTMVTEGVSTKFTLYSDFTYFSLTVDWGDGTIKRYSSEEYTTKNGIGTRMCPEHIYRDGKNSHTIKIRGSYKMQQIIHSFNCFGMQLTELNIECPSLTKLSCTSNLLTSLNTSGCPSLTILFCGSNLLTSLNTSGCPSLTKLFCGSNLLTSLDVSQNTKLTDLICSNNQLTSLDISKNTELTWLVCINNQLTSLDVSKNTALTSLYCYDNQFSRVGMNRLYESLPRVTGYPGSLRCDPLGEFNIAKRKNWDVFRQNSPVVL